MFQGAAGVPGVPGTEGRPVSTHPIKKASGLSSLKYVDRALNQ